MDYTAYIFLAHIVPAIEKRKKKTPTMLLNIGRIIYNKLWHNSKLCLDLACFFNEDLQNHTKIPLKVHLKSMTTSFRPHILRPVLQFYSPRLPDQFSSDPRLVLLSRFFCTAEAMKINVSINNHLNQSKFIFIYGYIKVSKIKRFAGLALLFLSLML